MGPEAEDKAIWYVGIDSGSWTTKAVVIDEQAQVLGSAVVRSAADLATAASRAFNEALGASGIGRESIQAIWSTGFGRRNVSFADGTRTELDCHARGVSHYIPGPLTVVDIGGQDAKVIKLDARNRRIGHKMNRKCAAGTGAFLEEMALRLGVRIEDFPELAERYQEEIELGSFCTVFSATEVLAAIRQGKSAADLARAAYRSVVKRVLEMEQLAGAVVVTGGVAAHHPAVVQILSELTGRMVVLPPHPQEMGAFGAALVARARAEKDQKQRISKSADRLENEERIPHQPGRP